LPVVPALDVSRYYNFQDLSDYLRTAEEAAPHLMRLFSIGNSYEGRPLLLVEITNRATGEGHEKPAIWVDGNLQGCELFGSSACLELVRQLTSNYGRDTAITDLLDHCTFYVAPRLSPDGAEHCLTTGEIVRSGIRPYPPTAVQQGLHAADVDGDGQVLQMRVVDPQGEWKVSRRDPRLLVPRLADDRQGVFYRLYPEGVVEGYDGLLRVQGPRSNLDFDRNFPYRWNPGWELEGAGPYPLSEPETRSVIDFFRTHRNLCLMLSCGSMGKGVETPAAQGADANLYRLFGRRIEELSGWDVSTHGSAQPGSFLEWAYQHQGLVAFRVKGWCLGRAAGLEVKDPDAFQAFRSEPDSVALLRWLDRELQGRGFASWTAFDHPQLGAVELGGWDLLNTWLNPPPGSILQGEVERFSRLCLGLASSLPRLGVRSCSEEVVGWSEFTSPEVQQGEFLPLRKVRVELENRGYLPTWLTEQAQKAGLADRVQLRLLMDAQTEILLGQVSHAWGQLAGSCSALCTHGLDAAWFSGADEAQRGSYEWLVRGSGRLQVEVRHVRAGLIMVASQMGRASSPLAEIPVAPGLMPTTQHAPPPPPPPLPPPPPPPSMRPSVDPRIAATARASGFGNLPALPSANQSAPVRNVPQPVSNPAAARQMQPLTPPPVDGSVARPAAFGQLGQQRPGTGMSHAQPQAHGGPPRPIPQNPPFGAPPRQGAPPLPVGQPAAQAQARPTGALPALPGRLPPPPLAEEPRFHPGALQADGAALAPQETAPGRGRVLGAPPTRPGEGFANRSQEPAQGNRSAEGIPPARASSEGDAFSPGLPIRPAYPASQQQTSPMPSWPAEPPPSSDFDSFPPEAPAAESRIPAPLLLRKRDGNFK
jgi:hypothetical protein